MALSKRTKSDIDNLYERYINDSNYTLENLQTDLEELSKRNSSNTLTIVCRMGSIRSYMRKNYELTVSFEDYDRLDRERRLINSKTKSTEETIKTGDNIIRMILNYDNLELPDGYEVILADTDIRNQSEKINKLEIFYKMIVYLQFQTSCRISEIVNGLQIIDDVVHYNRMKTATKRLVAIELIQPEKLDIVKRYNNHMKEFVKQYNGKDLFNTITSRINKFIKINISPKLSSHGIRKLSVQYHADSIDKTKVKPIIKIQNRLKHVSLDSSNCYNIKITKTFECDVCNITILKKSKARHIRSKRHQDNQSKLNQ